MEKEWEQLFNNIGGDATRPGRDKIWRAQASQKAIRKTQQMDLC